MTIRVTEANIKEGHRGSCRQCPVALAMLRAGLLFAYVGPYMTWWDGTKHQVAIPEAVREFIFRFDGDMPVWPFSFQLDAARG